MNHHFQLKDYPEYSWIDTAFGGACKRNHVMTVSELENAAPATVADCFATIPRYTVELSKHVKEKGTVAGFRGTCCIDWLILDIDGPQQNAARNAQRNLAMLADVYECDLKFVDCYSSGGGIHILIPGSMFGGFKPSNGLPDIMRYIAVNIGCQGIDISVYNHLRLFRLPITFNSKAGRWKRQVKASDILNRPEEIFELSKESGGSWCDLLEFEEPEQNERLTGLYKRACERIENQSKPTTAAHTVPRNFGNPDPICISRILQDGVEKGMRQPASLRLAVFYKKKGVSLNTAIDMLCLWDKKNQPPKQDALDVYNKAATNVYASNWDYGCNDKVRSLFCDPLCRYYKGNVRQIKMVSANTNNPSLQERKVFMTNNENAANKPIRKYNALHGLSIAVFENPRPSIRGDGTTVNLKSFNLQKSFLEKTEANGQPAEQWKNQSISLNLQDLPIVEELVRKAREEFLVQVQS
jgi:hypothetical protein